MDLRALAFLRISLALLILCDLILRAANLKAHYTDAGVLPRSALIAERFIPVWRISLHLISGQWAVQLALFILAGFFALMLLAGYRTRLATFASWFLMISLQVRNPFVTQASDRLFNLLLFWSLFLPLGARFSVDEVLSPPRRQREPDPVFSIGSVAYSVQMVLVYWISAIQKFRAVPLPVWKQGSAIYYALSVDQFATPLGHALLHFPLLLKFLTYAVLGFEIVGPLLLFSPVASVPLRVAALLGFLFLHVGFQFCIEVGMFPWIALAGIVPFVPAPVWDKLSGPLAALENVWKRIASGIKNLGGVLSKAGPTLGKGLALFCLIYVLVWNGENINARRYGIPRPFKWFGTMLGLDQRWAMFAEPPRSGGWYVVQGKLNNKTLIDLFRDGQVLNWDKPPLISATFKDQYWRKFMESLLQPAVAKERLYYSAYLCQEWNAAHRGDTQLTEVRIYFVSEKTIPEKGERTPPQIARLSTYECFKPAPKKATPKDKPKPPGKREEEKAKSGKTRRGFWPFR